MNSVYKKEDFSKVARYNNLVPFALRTIIELPKGDVPVTITSITSSIDSENKKNNEFISVQLHFHNIFHEEWRKLPNFIQSCDDTINVYVGNEKRRQVNKDVNIVTLFLMLHGNYLKLWSMNALREEKTIELIQAFLKDAQDQLSNMKRTFQPPPSIPSIYQQPMMNIPNQIPQNQISQNQIPVYVYFPMMYPQNQNASSSHMPNPYVPGTYVPYVPDVNKN